MKRTKKKYPPLRIGIILVPWRGLSVGSGSPTAQTQWRHSATMITEISWMSRFPLFLQTRMLFRKVFIPFGTLLFPLKAFVINVQHKRGTSVASFRGCTTVRSAPELGWGSILFHAATQASSEKFASLSVCKLCLEKGRNNQSTKSSILSVVSSPFVIWPQAHICWFAEPSFSVLSQSSPCIYFHSYLSLLIVFPYSCIST